MRVIDADKMRDLFYYGINDKPIISPEIDKLMLEIIEKCSNEIDKTNI